jgi:large subunit ribosomal protein L15
MQLNEVRPARGAVHKRKRVGRGPGSGHGGTATKGHKGSQARAGRAKGKSFEGGQMPITRRLPKFGFKNPFRVEYQVVNVGLLQERFEAGARVDTDALFDRGLLQHRKSPVKLLANGNLTKKLSVHVDAASQSAKQKVEAAGGSVAVQVETAPPKAKAAKPARPAAGGDD